MRDLSPSEEALLEQEREDYAAYQADLDAREQEVERILTKAAAILTHDELDLLRVECGITRKSLSYCDDRR